MEVIDKLAIEGKFNPVLIEMAPYGLLKFGKISVPYIMRKLKVSGSTAKVIVASLPVQHKINYQTMYEIL